MSAEEQSHVAEVMPNMGARLFAAKDSEAPETLRSLAFRQNPDEPWYDTLNSPVWRTAEIASGNGHGNARGVARIYAAMARGGELDGVRLMSKDSVERMTTEQHNQVEQLQDRPYHQALGVLLNTPEAVYMGPNPRAFGHHGNWRLDRLRRPRRPGRLLLCGQQDARRRRQRPPRPPADRRAVFGGRLGSGSTTKGQSGPSRPPLNRAAAGAPAGAAQGSCRRPFPRP